jgi:hypothetical protein
MRKSELVGFLTQESAEASQRALRVNSNGAFDQFVPAFSLRPSRNLSVLCVKKLTNLFIECG